MGILFFLVLIVSMATYRYLYQSHESISDQKSEYSGTTQNLFIKVAENPENWNNKVVTLSGSVTHQDSNSVTLDRIIYSTLESKNHTSLPSKVTVKGRIVGFDELLEEIKLEQSIIINN